MPKPNPLAQGLSQARATTSAPVVSEAPPFPLRQRAAGASWRNGRALIGGHFATEVQRALRILAAEEGTTIQALLAEGINTVFARRGKPEIASLSTDPVTARRLRV